MGTSAILGAILGFAAAALPKVFRALADYLEHRKNLENTAQQIDAATKGVTVYPPIVEPLPPPPPPPPPMEVESVIVPVYETPLQTRERLVEESEDAVNAGEVALLGRWPHILATLRAGIRPLITYSFFVLFAYVKLKGMIHGLYVDHTPAVTLLPVLWDEGTQAMFAAVIAFWFGTRAMEKPQESAASTVVPIPRVSAGNNP